MQDLIAENWEDYALIATGNGQRLERFANKIILRPDPNVLWIQDLQSIPEWRQLAARFTGGEEKWQLMDTNLEKEWTLSWQTLKVRLKLTPFRHVGVFPEQVVHWQWLEQLIREQNRPLKVLNLFAYTGASTIVGAAAGSQVTHVDASKGTVYWASENAELSGVKEKIRWIVDDALKFMQREIKRGAKYDIILMDPPVFGRGPKGEIWRLEEGLPELFAAARDLFSSRPAGLLINFYATELYPYSVARLAEQYFHLNFPKLTLYSLLLKEKSSEKHLATGFSLRS